MKIEITLSLMLLFLFGGCSYAQEAITSSGSNAIGSGGSVSYSAGQVAYTSQTGTNAKITQGVQQPYEFFVTGVSSNKNIRLEMIVYPNPTCTVVNLRIDNTENLRDFIYLLYDTKGTLLQQQYVLDQITEIPMFDFAAGNYIIRVTNRKNEILQTFKIIKN